MAVAFPNGVQKKLPPRYIVAGVALTGYVRAPSSGCTIAVQSLDGPTSAVNSFTYANLTSHVFPTVSPVTLVAESVEGRTLRFLLAVVVRDFAVVVRDLADCCLLFERRCIWTYKVSPLD